DGVDPAGIVASAEAVIRFEDPVTGTISTVELEGPPTGPFTGSYTTPAETSAGALTATAEVRMTTTGGAALVSQSAPRELPVLRPGGSVQYAPPSLKMPSLTGTGSTSADLVLVGGDADGCVWFGPTDVPEPPQGAGTIDVALDTGLLPGEDDCIEVAAGEQVTLAIEVSPSGRASGTVSGFLEVHERVEGAEATTTDLAFRFDLARGVDEARRLLLAALLLVGGLGLPLLVLVIVNAITARFQRLSAVRGAAIPVRVRGRNIERSDGAASRKLVLREGDFSSMADAGDDRSFRFGGVEFRARASRNPFGGTVAMAVPEGGAEKLKGRAGSRVELDPGLAGSWVFLLDSDKTRRAPRGEAVGLLIAFVAEGEFARQSERLLADVDERLPSTASRLTGLLAQVKHQPKPTKRRGDGNEAPAAGVASGPEGEDDPPTDAPPAEADPLVSPAAVSDAEPAPPIAPTGFGGAAGAGVGPLDEIDPPEGSEGDDDPPTAPVGFGGGRPG
ncbi:MAG: hypothetical protein KDA97_10145, partial [Acidimicrobiales bacterium]|nr:hypothetical protein [Acidimicrobiales bacterium]